MNNLLKHEPVCAFCDQGNILSDGSEGKKTTNDLSHKLQQL